MDCSKCEVYKNTNGSGTKKCLRCKQYKGFQVQSTKRQTIKYEHIPQAILENVADTPQATEMITIIRKLPPTLSLIITAHCIAGLSILQIAEQLNLSERHVTRKKNLSLAIIREALK
jgi:DNA-binding NarL/FixJ family response regulator